MLTAIQMEKVKTAGYRVVASDRHLINPRENTYSVQYPNLRQDAVSNQYSQATFATPELAWDSACLDYEAGGHLLVQATPADLGWNLE